jgi:hypothetical protein
MRGSTISKNRSEGKEGVSSLRFLANPSRPTSPDVRRHPATLAVCTSQSTDAVRMRMAPNNRHSCFPGRVLVGFDGSTPSGSARHSTASTLQVPCAAAQVLVPSPWDAPEGASLSVCGSGITCCCQEGSFHRLIIRLHRRCNWRNSSTSAWTVGRVGSAYRDGGDENGEHHSRHRDARRRGADKSEGAQRAAAVACAVRDQPCRRRTSTAIYRVYARTICSNGET